MSDVGDNLNRIKANLRRLEEEGSVIALPTRNGLLGRECPACQRFFEIETSADLPTMHCPYCGAANSQDQFWSAGQLALARETAAHEANKAIAQALGQPPSVPAPLGALPAIEHTSREVACSACQFRFGINGSASHCPRCGADPD